MRIHLDKIASVTRTLQLGRWVTLSPEIQAVEGAVVAGRILGEKSVYNQLEDVHGRMSVVHDGDIIVGALGHRNALHGYEGLMPASVKAGDVLQLLNLGGVIGQCVSSNPDVGAPFGVEILGQVQIFPSFGSRVPQAATIQSGAVKGSAQVRPVPVIFVAGTCMNSGKTHAACALVRHFAREGYRVAGAKLTGVSLMRDVLAMRDYGADIVMDFTDAGVACTEPSVAAHTARVIFSELASKDIDLIVAETGDGIMGDYGVQNVLADPELRQWAAAYVLCANDPVGVAGGIQELRERYGISVDVVTGPATDNRVGVRFVENLGLPAFNARTAPKALGALLLAKLGGALGKARGRDIQSQPEEE
ncbi:MAG TPA: hypothetical protein PKL14_06465 [Holophaga sp.]|jgi:hypothetical protein|nr:hypothetical protein [Holophaga sp.]